MSKKALVIGINYIGTSSSLNGCINDAHNIKNELEKRGYSPENITLLSDETEAKPTRANILGKLLELILSGADELFFHYSGHGSYIIDLDSDESDGKDECLVPLDYGTSGMIIDDEIRGILSCLSEKQKILFILDCCHSGSGVDLAYNLYERQGGAYLIMQKDSNCKPTRGECIALSGCQDADYSSDAYIGGKFQGAMTCSFLQALNQKSDTYEGLIKNIRKNLKDSGFSQIAQISSGKKLNLKSQFKL